ncbi:Tetratricopeptide repeat protein 29 [Saguinus oedipus]|uniref:Tetratricopeptide repeat protein 29 n=1 Tax=Saguinus oedipus TaxID=9490 RepID=A0ABQ9W3R2_SAGOE|nr:Tetratricopeptide repeat protein 29 [Saguinus oedipus]
MGVGSHVHLTCNRVCDSSDLFTGWNGPFYTQPLAFCHESLMLLMLCPTSHVGLGAYSSTSQLLEAAEHYEAFHQLTQGRIWKDETGRFLNLLACESLLRTYRLLSDKMLENKEYKQAIKILIKASEIAKEGSDKKMEGEACYYLGLAHLAAEEYDLALTLMMRIQQCFVSDTLGSMETNQKHTSL